MSHRPKTTTSPHPAVGPDPDLNATLARVHARHTGAIGLARDCEVCLHSIETCARKIAHPNHHDALQHCVLVARDQPGDAPMVPYQCMVCEGFHVGHPNKRAR